MTRHRNALVSTMAAAAIAVVIAATGAAPASAAASTRSATPSSVASVQLYNWYTGTCLDAIDWYVSPTTGMANLFSCTNTNDVRT